MKLNKLGLLAVFGVILLTSSSAMADVLYVYTGQVFDIVNDPTNLTGKNIVFRMVLQNVTTSLLNDPSVPITEPDLLAWRMTDGLNTFASLNSDSLYLSVAFDAFNMPNTWTIVAYNSGTLSFDSISSVPVDQVFDASGLAAQADSIGVWKLYNLVGAAENPDPEKELDANEAVPEPSSLLLLGTGLAGIIVAGWRKRK